MRDQIETLLDGYDAGTLGRNELIDQLVVAAGGDVGRRGNDSMFQTLGLNHVALAVSDVGAMADFLGQHFGTTVASQNENAGFIQCGANHFVGLFRRDWQGLDHVCFTVEGYDADDAQARIEAAGHSAHRVEDRVFFRGPDDILFQVASPWGEYPQPDQQA